ncbi:MAG: peptide MFS transporter [Deltaproteobacteria bacterium]|nr:peptide MFS transporter [Deltaproteobacteria bacterium]
MQHHSGEIWGHPTGLVTLFFTEMWERFSYYGMRAILVLYLVSETKGHNPGLGWTHAEALALYGWYTMAVYLASIPGGYLADRYIGQKKAVLSGGLLLCAGHLLLAFNALWAFYTGLTFIVLGVGCLKPNISTMVGGLYQEGDYRRDSGFTIFYIGINLGALLAGFLVGWIGETIGWHYGFALAGFGMLLGQIVYIKGQKHLRNVGNPVSATTVQKVSSPLNHVEKDRILVLLLSYLIIIVFFGAFEQAGGLMNLYAMEKVNRMVFGTEIPASVFQSMNPLFILLFGGLVASWWSGRRQKGKESSSLYKMAIGTIVMGAGFLLMSAASQEASQNETGLASIHWLVGAYFLHTLGELCASPVALSFITKLAPARYASLMMGLFFAATGLGNKIAGLIGEQAATAGELQIFNGIFIFCAIFGAGLLLFLKKLKTMTHGAEDEIISIRKNPVSAVDSMQEEPANI